MKVSKYLDPDIIKDGTIEGDKKIKNYPPLEKGSVAYSVQQVLCNATSNYSFAEGLGTEASGGGAHAEGEYTIASGFCSHTEGERTKTSGSHSHAEGYYTTTSNQGEHSEGKYNISIKDKTIHTVGIGTEDSDRKNAHEIHTDGKHYIFGIGGYEGNNSQTEGIKTLQEVVNGKQDKLTAGAGINIDENNNISINFDPDIFKVVTELPASPAEGDERKIHLVPTSDTESANAYDEYIYVDGTWEKIGSFRPTIDLSDYAKTEDIPIEKGTGVNSVVQKGRGNIASGVGSVAVGAETKAFGEASHAEGIQTIAFDDTSHAEGSSTFAIGIASHSEGRGSIEQSSFTVTGEANATTYTTSTNHTLGVGEVIMYNNVYRKIINIPSSTSFTVDSTLSSDALNGVNIYIVYGVAYGGISHAEGEGTVASGGNSHAEGRGTLALGIRSHTEGWNTTASGSVSHAEGSVATASGTSSHAEGNFTTASGGSSHAEGYSTNASGGRSHSEGSSTTASGDYSHAEGSLTKATGESSHAEGKGTTASGARSHAEGYNTTASNDYSHAEGNQTTASAQSSHAEGASTTASGKYSHAEGNGTTASDWYSHAEGTYTTASGQASHAEGDHTTASDHSSHAEGNRTTAYGISSHAEGNSTIAAGEASHAEGSYNYDYSSFIHMTGVGTGESNRLNALSITYYGKVYVKDVGGYAGQDPIGNDLRTHLDSTDLTDYEIDVIFGTVVNTELDIYSIYMDRLRDNDPEWYQRFGVNDKYEFVNTLITDGEVSGPSKSFNINQSHRFMNTGQQLTYEGVTYNIFADVNGDDIDDAGGVYRMLINPNIDTYTAVSEHQLYGSTTSDGKYKFTMLNPDIDELYEGASNMWSRQYVYYVEKVSN